MGGHSSYHLSPSPCCTHFVSRHCHLVLVLLLLPQTVTASASITWLFQAWHLQPPLIILTGLLAIFVRRTLLETLLTTAMWSICLSYLVADLLVTGVKKLAIMVHLQSNLYTPACRRPLISCGSINDSISHTRSLSSTSLDSITTCDAYSITGWTWT